MATLADSLISASSRPIKLRVRSDLTARRQRYHGRVYWVVKEPVGLNYYRFHEEEYAILQMLDGHTSLEQIKDRFEAEFTPQKITFGDLQQFIGMLHRSGLVTSFASGQGRQLKRRRDEKKRKELLGKLSNVFALRWRGIDPEWILNRIYPYTGWVFSAPALILFLLYGLSALMLVMVQFEEFRSRLPSFHEFFGSWHNWIALAIVMGTVKVLHEFGHGLSCKHFGGECHEMGFMLLVFTPALYCNVSDSWMLPNKWHRVLIGAAGMYVEMTLAATATWIWWFSEPGLLNHLCLSVMFICSVSTLLFNGNPLLRFDGYYILMDISEIPNLRQKSTEVLRRFLVNLCLGIEQPENPFLPQENKFFFGLYTVAAVIYRWIVVFSILWFLNTVLEPYGLKVIGRIIGAVGVFGLVVMPLIKLVKFFYMPGRMRKLKKHRLIATIGVVAALILIVAAVPLPYHVRCSLEIVPRTAEAVYAGVDGQLVEQKVEAGQQVDQGAVLARIDNINLQLTVEELKGRRNELKTRLDALHRQRFSDPRAVSQIPQLEKELAAVNDQLEETKKELDRLVIVAPIAGTVIPPPDRPKRGGDDGRLPAWSGTPLEKRNLGAYLAESDMICHVGDPTDLEAVLVIDQADVELLRKDSDGRWPEVDIRLESYPNRTYNTRIEQVADSPMKFSPVSLSTQGGGSLNTVTDPETGAPKPMSTSYQARAVLTDDDGILRVGLRGQAKIYTGWQPLGQRVYRYVARTFHFDM